MEYLREDHIFLAGDDDAPQRGEEEWSTAPDPALASSEDEEDDSDDDDEAPAPLPPDQKFPETHQAIKDAIAELGGEVVPKLNWSAPKDSKWMSPYGNTLMCKTPNDIYLLLKSSSFVSHDLEHALEDTVSVSQPPRPLKHVLVLRPYYSNMKPSLEFRCFVKQRTLIGICPREKRWNPHLAALRPQILARVDELFHEKLRYDFPDPSFVFDVYLPENDAAARGGGGGVLGRARLVDINPWAPRTDSLLFKWHELLQARVPDLALGSAPSAEEVAQIMDSASSGGVTTDDDDEEDEYQPELRLIEEEYPTSHDYSSPEYSVNQMPVEIHQILASGEMGIMRELTDTWMALEEGRIRRLRAVRH